MTRLVVHEDRVSSLRPPDFLSRRSIEERFVWWLWQTKQFDSAAARRLGFDVVFPGWFSTGAGPDFRDAMIAGSDGRLRQGDVEIHVVDSAWRDHGHDRDPAYDGVILHVVLRRDSLAPTITWSALSVPILQLEPLLTHSVGELHTAMGDWQPALVGCPSHQLSSVGFLESLLEAGHHRFRDKTSRMRANVEGLGHEEALYRDLAESLGYGDNREGFRKIAEALPLSLLSSLTLFQKEQVLLSAAGLIDQDNLFATLLDAPVLKRGELKTFRVRPNNHPALRLRALARLIETHRHGLVDAITSCPVEKLWMQFVVTAETPLLGRSRADDMVLNVALPYLTAYRDVDGEAYLQQLPAPSGNRWVSSLRSHLCASGLTIRPYRAIHHLGLQELSLRYCRFDHCEACPLHDRQEVPQSDHPATVGSAAVPP